MAFNLDKGTDGDQKRSGRPPKFDLSKNEAGAVETKGKKSNYWLLLPIAIVLIAGSLWYFSSGLSSAGTKAGGSAVAVAVHAKESQAPALPTKDSTRTVAKETSIDSKTTASVKAADNIRHSQKVAASFRTGSAALTGISNAMVKDLVAHAGNENNDTIHINGYASSEGPLRVNQKISQRRADAFKRYLVSKGIAGNKIIATGKGIDNPIAPNDTEEGRRKNRRVEVITE